MLVFRNHGPKRRQSLIYCADSSNAHLDILGVQTETFLLVYEEFLHILALVSLQLDHLAHLRVGHDGAIAGKLLLDDLEDLLLIELLGQALDRGQCLTTIALCIPPSANSVHQKAMLARPREGFLRCMRM